MTIRFRKSGWDGHTYIQTDRQTFGYYVRLYECMHTAGEEKVEGQEDTL